MKKRNLLLLGATLLLAACNTTGTSEDTKPSNNPFNPGGAETTNATELLEAALAKDYSNMTVDWGTYASAIDGDSYGHTIYYKGYMIVCPTDEYNLNYYYYHEYNGDIYLYFTPDTNYQGSGTAPEAWLKNGYNDVSLDPSYTEFVMRNFVNTITPTNCTYEAALGCYYVDPQYVEKVGLKIFGFAWDNDINQIIFSLDDNGYIQHIRGYDINNEDDIVAVDLSEIGTTTFDDSKLPSAPNSSNVMEYWQYKGLPYKDADKIYIDSLSISQIKVANLAYESVTYQSQFYDDMVLDLVGDKFVNQDCSLEFYTQQDGEYEYEKATFIFDPEIDPETLTKSSYKSTTEYSVYEGKKTTLTRVKDTNKITIKSRYETTSQPTVEVDKTFLVGAILTPYYATIRTLKWKTSNGNVLTTDNNANGTVCRPGVTQFIAKPVETDTEVEIWCEAESSKEGTPVAVSNKIKVTVKAIGTIDKTNAQNDLYFTKLQDHTSAPSICKETYANEDALSTAYPEGAEGYFYLSDSNEVVKFYQMNDKYHYPEWISLGTCTNSVIAMKDMVADDSIVGECGKVALFDPELANAELFKGTRKILGFEPCTIGQGHMYPCYLQFKVNSPVNNIAFNYGAIYYGDLQGINQLSEAKIEYSADGTTWSSIDILDEIKADLSINTLRLMEKEFVGDDIEYIRISFHSNNIGAQIRIGVQNIVLF